MKPFILIDAFKEDQPDLYVGGVKPAHKIFRSSGTTAAERSFSRFSPEGLAAYREAALKQFRWFLREYAPRFLNESVRCLSFVPSPAMWPDSSLAWMVALFEEVMPVCFLASWKDLEEALMKDSAQNPVLVFGTAFHFLNHEEDGVAPVVLPKGSIIVETGGTKGRSRQVTRDELGTSLCRMFTVGPEQLFSEYSMCELASQAWAPFGQPYRFPPEVKLQVVCEGDQFFSEGEGLLALWDEHRRDVPFVIVTEDVVRLEKGGAFGFRGRVPEARVRGCSLLAESAVGSSKSFSAEQPSSSFDDGNVDARLKGFLERWERFCRSGDLVRAFAEESPSTFFAETFARKLQGAMPQTFDSWKNALRESLASGTSPWMLILPTNHGAAGLYPLTFASLLGIPLHVRWPKLKSELALKTWISLIDVSMFSFDYSGSLIRSADETGGRGLMVFGSDETASTFRQMGIKNLRAFAGEITVGVIGQGELPACENKIMEDACELFQRGCKSLRLLLVVGEGEVKPLKVQLGGDIASHLKTLKFLHAKRKHAESISPWSESFLMAEFPGKDLTLFPFEMALPVYRFESWNEAKEALLKSPMQSLRLGLSPLAQESKVFQEFESLSLGRCQVVPWDGTYGKKPLFSFD